MNNDIKLIEDYLNGCLQNDYKSEKAVIDAMRYSLMAGGKRLRPRLAIEFAKACKGSVQDVLPYACSVEMIHTYSLIHDDLPCMDNDSLRRGKPANHIVFGEDIALLAGDALQTLAFETLSRAKNTDNALKAVAVLAKASGAVGMVGGQIIDLQSENKIIDLETVKEMYAKKTGALIAAACVMGCLASSVDDKEKLGAAEEYGKCIGLAFQIEDDILDIVSTTDELGKPIGSDEENNKSTYVSILGIEQGRRDIKVLTEKALGLLEVFGDNTESLKELALSLVNRQN